MTISCISTHNVFTVEMNYKIGTELENVVKKTTTVHGKLVLKFKMKHENKYMYVFVSKMK